MYTSVSKIFAFGLLVSAPLANALAIPSQSQDLARSVDSIEARHHTEAQIAVSSLTPTTIQGSANTRKAKKAKANAATPATTATAKCGRSIEDREPHHTEAQIVSFPASTNHRKCILTQSRQLRRLRRARQQRLPRLPRRPSVDVALRIVSHITLKHKYVKSPRGKFYSCIGTNANILSDCCQEGQSRKSG
jgi:hypothetical protein